MDLLGNDISIDDIRSVPDDTEFRLESILAEYGEGERPSSERIRPAAAPRREERREDPPWLREEPVRPQSASPARYAAGAYGPPGGVFSRYAEEERAPAPGAGYGYDKYAPEERYSPERDTALSPEDGEYAAGPEHGPEFAPAYSPRAAAPEDVADDDVKIYSLGDTSEEPARSDTREEGHNFGSPHRDYGLFGGDQKKAGAEEQAPNPKKTAAEMDSRRGSFLTAPFVGLAALFAMMRQQRQGVAAVLDTDEEDLGPEVSAEKAYKYYAGNLNALKRRLPAAIVLGLLLVWIAFGLPTFGALRAHVAVRTLVCLILELAIVMMGLDVFTAGITALLRGRPSMWTLVSLACIFSGLDAAVSVALGTCTGASFCAVSGVSMVGAIWGSMLTCRGFRRSMRALAMSKDPYAVTAESAVTDDGVTLLKSKRGTAGFIRRCEEPDCMESVFAAMAPFLLAGALLLSVAAAWKTGEWESFFRILAAITCASAPLAVFFAFSLPFSMISKSLFHSGAAICGWPGLRDIGRSRHLIVTDRDIFPNGTISIDGIRVLEGMYPDKVISYAGSLIAASGSDLGPVFAELMSRNSCLTQIVDDFRCHEGGGLTAMINGEEVLCGNAGFMRLMSIRLPQRLTVSTSVFISINGVLSGVFTIKYVPVTSVQDALVSLLHTRREPIFAVRDFLVTPLMIKNKFRMPSDTFDFPSFAKRYDISAAEPSPESQISAILSREGLGPLAQVSDKGRRLYGVIRLCSVLAVICALFGMGLMFFNAFSGTLNADAVTNLLTYMFLWLLPIVVLAFGLGR